ncbi:MAG: GNAT family N-acetyltransferase [Chloroflexi bacterium]|nr:GNAT family N-acetyltransferase [Chloroflexota bacterium]
MIRLAQQTDIPRISQLWAQMAAQHAQLDASTFRPAADGAESYARFIEDRLRDSFARVLVAEVEGKLVGYISGGIADINNEMFESMRCGMITDIFVCVEQRRQGIGRRLVERLMLWFRACEVTSFEWYASAHNPTALAFWRALGGEATLLRMRAMIPGDES